MKKIYEFKNQRSTLLTDAETALNGQNMELYNAKMAEVKALNEQIAALEDLEVENNKFMKDGITNLSGVTGGTTERNDKEYLEYVQYFL
jgi:hypothetical protein